MIVWDEESYEGEGETPHNLWVSIIVFGEVHLALRFNRFWMLRPSFQKGVEAIGEWGRRKKEKKKMELIVTIIGKLQRKIGEREERKNWKTTP